jgi:hypothetical protein
VAWSAAVLAVTGGLVIAELAAPCPPGGPLSLGQCAAARPVTLPVVVVGAILYVAGLSAVLGWVSRLRSRRLADGRAARDWYLLAAFIGLPVAPLLAFTIVSALR